MHQLQLKKLAAKNIQQGRVNVVKEPDSPQRYPVVWE